MNFYENRWAKPKAAEEAKAPITSVCIAERPWFTPVKRPLIQPKSTSAILVAMADIFRAGMMSDIKI